MDREEQRSENVDRPQDPNPDAAPAGELAQESSWPATVDHVGATAADRPLGMVRSFGDYELLEEIGHGGMGVVFKARQRSLKRIVALKMILKREYASQGDLARFRTEAEAIARLQHPNIVQIFEVSEHDGQPFLSLEYCAEGSLDRRLGGTPLPPNVAARLVEILAGAVQAAHQAQILHRDLKPANVLLVANSTGAGSDQAAPPLESLVPKLTDFGLAKKLDGTGGTQTGAIMGTPSYMAPEQAAGKKDVGPATDTYALGAILYECLTGRPPFKAAEVHETLLQVIGEEPVPPRQVNAQVPRDLETIALKCLRKEPGKRYASAADLGEDLRRFGNGEPIKARRWSRRERLVRWVRKNPMLAAGTSLLTLLAVGLAAVALWLQATQRNLEEALNAQERYYSTALYAADVQRAFDALQQNDLATTEQLLGNARADLRGWEWHHLARQCRRICREYYGHVGDSDTIGDVQYTADGHRLVSVGRNTIRIYDVASRREVSHVSFAAERLEVGLFFENPMVRVSPSGALVAAWVVASEKQEGVDDKKVLMIRSSIESWCGT